MNQNRYSKIFTKKKVASSAVCVVLAVSLFAGCAHFESIEYSQEISEENPETIEAFDQFINDIFETEVTENTINLHFTISDPEKYGITDYPVTLGDLSIDAMADSNARLENYLSGLNSFSYTELTLNQQLTYDILENYFKLQLDMADMYLYDELLRPSTGVQAQLPILYEEYSFNSKKDVEDYLKLLALTDEYFDQIISFDFFTEHSLTEVTENTINLHFTISDPEKYGITDYPVTLGDLSNDAMSDSNARLENYLSGLSSFSYTELTLNQQLTYDILENYFQLQLDMADMYLYDELLRPSTGVQAQLPILYEEYSFNSKKDVEDYLKLLALTDEYFDQIISFEKEKADAGLFMSDFACQNIIDQCNAFIADSDNHYLIETFNTRIDKLTGLTQSEKDHYRLQNEKMLLEHIFPAYENLAAALTDLLGSGTNENGLCYFPEGKQYYEYLLAYNTGASESVKTLENMISNERVKVLQESSDLTTENPELWELASEATLTPTDSATTLNHLKEVMLDDFPAPPETSYTVNYIDDCVADYLAPAFYVIAPIDDYSHNSIYINETTDTTNISYFTTLAHEGFPGHLYQTVMTYESGIEPVRSILNYSGFVEGWATYVEFQSYHYAGLDDDVATILELNQDATLSLYASTDIGIHYEGWTLEDTKKFWNNYGITNDDAIESIFELIVEEPTHYLKYYIGFLKFEELKKETSLKNIKNYNDKSFHQAVLSIGPAPFDIVDKYLPAYYEYIE